MKIFKLVSLMLCAVMGFAAFGCSATPSDPLFDEVFPWSEKRTLTTETLTYEFARFLTGIEVDQDFLSEGEVAEKGYKLTDSGSVVYTIKVGCSVSFADGVVTEVTGVDGHTLLKAVMVTEYKTNLTLVPRADVRNLFSGAKYTITTYAVMDRYSAATLFSFSRAEFVAASRADDWSYTLVTDYTGDFGGRGSTLTNDGEPPQIRTASIKNGTNYDPESLYFQVRAMRSITKGGSRGFSISRPHASIVRGIDVSAEGITQTTAADLSKVELSDRVLGMFDVPAPADIPDEGEEVEKVTTLACFSTSLKLDADKSGHKINLFFAQPKTAVDPKNGLSFAASKVLTKVTYTNQDPATKDTYNHEYTLINYSNTNY